MIDEKYACFSRGSPQITKYSKLSFRFTGYMSRVIDWMFRKSFEMGEFENIKRLATNFHSRHHSVRSTKVLYFNKFALPQPIDIKSIAGLSSFGVFVVGLVNLGINLFVFLVSCFIKWVKRVFGKVFDSCSGSLKIMRFNVRRKTTKLNGY